MIPSIVTTPKTEVYSLSEKELANPHLVITDLFCSVPHARIKELMWEWLKSTFCENFGSELDADEKTMIAILYEKIGKLIDAAHVMHNNSKQSR